MGVEFCRGEVFEPVTTQGDPMVGCGWWRSSEGGGVAVLSRTARIGGDLVSFEVPLPYELRDSSPLNGFLSKSLEFCLSFSLSFSFSFSRSNWSLTASLDFFRTRPAASRAVVARCMILTLPLRLLPSRRPLEPSFSLKLLTGLFVSSPLPRIVEVVDGARPPVGDALRGGVVIRGSLTLETIGVGGTNASSGAD